MLQKITNVPQRHWFPELKILNKERCLGARIILKRYDPRTSIILIMLDSLPKILL